MKNIITLIAIALLPTACLSIPATKATLHILDAETGLPMTNVQVNTGFLLKDYWDKPDEYKKIKVASNQEGICILEGNDLDHYRYVKANYRGFYESTVKVEAKKRNKILNRWEPWNPTIELKMRKIKNPIPMVHKGKKWKKFPVYGEPVSYDLEIGDWVTPHGHGKTADFDFLVVKSGNPSRAEYRLTFSNPEDGIMEHQFSEEQRSSFKWPYLAPESGYIDQLKKYKVYKNPSRPETNLKQTANYIFRVRTKTDKEGNIVSACYGRIRGEIELTTTGQYQFAYHFNPVPNERSLEYNGENLLRK